MARAEHILRTAGLSRRRATAFTFAPAAAERAALASDLGLPGLPALSLTGEVRPDGRADFVLSARLTARAVQSCVVTLEPVETTVDVAVNRRYLADMPVPAAAESEIPADTDAEPMPAVIDLAALAAEELMLALPLYPRAPGAESASAALAQAAGDGGPTPRRPFAALAALQGRGRTDGADGGGGGSG